MAAARKAKAFGWSVVAILFLAGAGVSVSRPAPALISVDQLAARSAADARTIAAAMPAKYADKRLSLQGAGNLPAALADVAKEDGVSAVRLWSPTGTLLASSDPSDAAAAAAAEKAAITTAHGANAQPSNLADQPGLLRLFEPVLPTKSNAAVAELVRRTRASALPFKAIGAGLAVLGVLGLIAAFVSLFAGASASAKAAPTPTAAGSSEDASDQTEDTAVTGTGPDRLAQKLKTSEASRAAMETQMQQLRAQLRMGTQGSEQIVADLDNSLASSQLRVHEAGEKLAVAETRAREAEQRALIAEEALSRATPSEAADQLVGLESELATANGTISDLQGAVAEHQARTRDAEARAGEAEKRSTAVSDQVTQHAARTAEFEGRQRELEDRATTAEVRTTQAEAALAQAVQRAADLEAQVTHPEAAAAAAVAGDAEGRAAVAQASVLQLQLELARAQDLVEQALAKLEASEGRAASAETGLADAQAKLMDAESRARDAEARASVAGAPAPNRAPKPTPPARPTPDSPPEARSPVEVSIPTAPAPAPVVAAPVVPVQGGGPPLPPVEEGTSATDPKAWKALAKTLRRNALGDEAGDEAEEEEAPEAPEVALTEDDRSELRARLAKASAKKRRMPE